MREVRRFTMKNSQARNETIIRAALDAASKLSTCQGCPEENHAVVVMAMEALKVLGQPEFNGSRFVKASPSVTLGCISTEARDLLGRVMKAWEPHLAALKKSNGQDYEPEYYGFAYWLIRRSGLVAPSVELETGSSTASGSPKSSLSATTHAEGVET